MLHCHSICCSCEQNAARACSNESSNLSSDLVRCTPILRAMLSIWKRMNRSFFETFKEDAMPFLHVFTLLLVLIGGINWGLVGLANLNLVETVFGAGPLTTVVYILVMLSACYHIVPQITGKVTK